MRIRRIFLRNFRKFVDPVTIEGIGDGLTVIAGDNEEGKSTLLKALRTVLFERHGLTGEAAEALKPFGCEVRPEIHLDFEFDGQPYKLRKGFCQQKFAELDTPNTRLHGPAVEEALQKVLRFDPPAKGSAGPKNQGIWGMFWLEQGTTHANVELNARARQSILSALEGEVGAVLGGQRGRDLLDAIGRRYSELFDAREHPRGDYRKALDRVTHLKTELEKVEFELRSYDSKIDALARARDLLRRYDTEGRLAQVLRERELAEQEQRRIESLAVHLKTATQQEQVANALWKTAMERWQRRADELRAAAEADTLVTRLELRVEAERKALAPQEESVQRAQAMLEAEVRAQDVVELEVRRLERLEQRARVAELLSGLRKRHTAATQAIEESTKARAQAEAIPIDDKKQQTLRRLEKEALEADAGLDAVATRLTFALDAGVSLRLAGQRLCASKPLLLTEVTNLELTRGEEHLGTLTITPGAEDLSERKQRAETAQRKLAAELRALGVSDVAAAEVLLKDRTELEARAQQQEMLANVHAKEGLDTLRQAMVRAEAEIAGGEFQAITDSLDEAALQLKVARARMDEVGKRAKQLRSAWEKESLALQSAQAALTKAEADLKAAHQGQRKAHDIVNAARKREDDNTLRASVDAAQAQLQEAEQATRNARTALAQAAPEEARLRLAAKTQAAELVRKDIEATQKQANDLEIELRTLGQRGLGERAQELRGELEQAQAVAARFAREAGATRLLYQTLRSAEREAKETFLSPVRERVQPYLNLLMPGSELFLADSDLSIAYLRRGGQDEPFESLSIGTREQLAVLTRLAFADLLREQGQPSAVVLDDALVYADDSRFESMLYVLRRAAEHQQILVLTCRERDYVSAGFPVIRLSNCRSADRESVPFT